MGTKALALFLQVADFPLLALLIEVTDRLGCERVPTGEHVVEDAGNLVRGGFAASSEELRALRAR